VARFKEIQEQLPPGELSIHLTGAFKYHCDKSVIIPPDVLQKLKLKTYKSNSKYCVIHYCDHLYIIRAAKMRYLGWLSKDEEALYIPLSFNEEDPVQNESYKKIIREYVRRWATVNKKYVVNA